MNNEEKVMSIDEIIKDTKNLPDFEEYKDFLKKVKEFKPFNEFMKEMVEKFKKLKENDFDILSKEQKRLYFYRILKLERELQEYMEKRRIHVEELKEYTDLIVNVEELVDKYSKVDKEYEEMTDKYRMEWAVKSFESDEETIFYKHRM
jgi:hypothetical protein